MTRPATKRMRTLSVIVSALALCATLLPAAPSLAQTLIWSDEFDGTAVDPANWEFMIGDGCAYGNCGWGNNELEYYTDRAVNCYVADGKLHFVARAESYGGREFTSARLRSLHRQDFQYGRMEGRIKLPTGGGMWPAFWMMPSDSVYGGWAASGEIDIVESINAATTVYGTIHYGGAWPNNVSSGGNYSNGGNFSQDFHIYAVDWTPDEMRWYVDGIQYFATTSAVWYSDSAPTNPRAPFDQEFHFLLNVAVGGNWPGCTQPSCITAALPQEMVVDWVRVYSNLVPTVQITNPTNGAVLPAGTVAITAVASETGGTIDRVEFYANGAYLGADATAPYGFFWNAADGCYVLKATAVDIVGRTADHAIAVSVGSPCLSQPFYGHPQPIPGRIEAEDFDLGAEGAAYHDCTTANSGGAYRPNSGVDIEACADGGYNVGWMCAGEWLNYAVEVATPGTYTVQARVASLATGGTFHVEFDSVDLTGDVDVPVTGGWQTWTTVAATADLAAGVHTMKFANGASADEYNLSYFNFVLTYPRADINRDGQVDAVDMELLITCLAGPDVITPPPGASAEHFARCDFDGDGDADARDLAVFQVLRDG